MKLKVWVEVLTTVRFTEDIVEIPDEEWAEMSDAERRGAKDQIFGEYRDGVANGGCEEVED